MKLKILAKIDRIIDRLPRKKLERWKLILQILLVLLQVLRVFLLVMFLVRRA